MKSIQKLSQSEKEIQLLIDSLKNVLTDVPYYIEDDDDEDDDEYYD